jgi:hypothetical protein
MAEVTSEHISEIRPAEEESHEEAAVKAADNEIERLQKKEAEKKNSAKAPLAPKMPSPEVDMNITQDQFDKIKRITADKPDTRPTIILEYVWVSKNKEMKSLTRTHRSEIVDVSDIPQFKYDGWLADEEDEEVVLIPYAMYTDPNRGGPNKFILCTTTGTEELRQTVGTLLKSIPEAQTYQLSQEYTFYDKAVEHPIGWSEELKTQNKSYCAIGSGAVYGRDAAINHYHTCIRSGIPLTALTSCRVSARWRYSIRGTDGLSAAAHLWASRYILQRMCEVRGVMVVFDSDNDNSWEGSNLSCHFSTKSLLSKENSSEEFVEKLRQIESLTSRNSKGFSPGTTNVDKVRLRNKGLSVEDGRYRSDSDPLEVVASFANTYLELWNTADETDEVEADDDEVEQV